MMPPIAQSRQKTGNIGHETVSIQAESSAELAKGVWEESQNLVQYPQEIELQIQDLSGQLVVAEKNVEMAQTYLKEAQIWRDEALRSQDGDAALTGQQIAQKQVDAAGVSTIIYTDTSRDGMMDGVNAFEMGKICSAVKCEVVASGGVSSLEDIKRLAALNCDNLTGAIVGKALYEETVTVKQLKKAAKG